MGQSTDGAHCFCSMRYVVARTRFGVSTAMQFKAEHILAFNEIVTNTAQSGPCLGHFFFSLHYMQKIISSGCLTVTELQYSKPFGPDMKMNYAAQMLKQLLSYIRI